MLWTPLQGTKHGSPKQLRIMKQVTKSSQVAFWDKSLNLVTFVNPAGHQILNIWAWFPKILKWIKGSLENFFFVQQKDQSYDVTTKEYVEENECPKEPRLQSPGTVGLSNREQRAWRNRPSPIYSGSVAFLDDDLTQEVNDSFVSSCLLSKTIVCLAKGRVTVSLWKTTSLLAMF